MGNNKLAKTTNNKPTKTVSNKKIQERVNTAFPNSAYTASEYLQILRANWQQLETDVKRASLFLFISVIAFELIARASVAEVSLGIVKVNDVSMIYRIIPAVVSYYCHNIMYLVTFRKKIENVHDSIIKKVYWNIYENSLCSYLRPHYGSLTSDDYLAPKNSKARSALAFLAVLTISALIIGLLAFEVYAFYQLFRTYKWKDLLVWFSLALSIIFLIRTIILSQVPFDE